MKLNSVTAKSIAKPSARRADSFSTAPRAAKKSVDDDDDFDEDDDLEIDEDLSFDDDDDLEVDLKEPATFEDFDDDDDDDDDF
jgi:DNA-directed RNA polymerase subunit delta